MLICARISARYLWQLSWPVVRAAATGSPAERQPQPRPAVQAAASARRRAGTTTASAAARAENRWSKRCRPRDRRSPDRSAGSASLPCRSCPLRSDRRCASHKESAAPQSPACANAQAASQNGQSAAPATGTCAESTVLASVQARSWRCRWWSPTDRQRRSPRAAQAGHLKRRPRRAAERSLPPGWRRRRLRSSRNWL